MSRREERERRRALRIQKFEANKAAFVAKVADEPRPKIAKVPKDSGAPHIAQAVAGKLALEKTPKAAKDGSRFHLQVTWCDSKADRVGHWTWGEPRDWEDHEWTDVIHPSLIAFGALTWGEIDQQASGTGHKMHHAHEIGDLVDEAQLRWIELDLEQYDTVFRFRLGGTRRLWGFVIQAHFHMVWWDRSHSIYPVD